MQQMNNLKAILHSKRANIYYLEMCRVMQKDGRVVYLSEERKEFRYWNIPIANTNCLLLGTGTSITQAAMRMLSQAGVLVGFCGGGGTPLFSGTEVEWLMPQSEYRPTRFVQKWLSFWFDDSKRLEAAKIFQESRVLFIKKVWSKEREFVNEGLEVGEIDEILENYKRACKGANETVKLLQLEDDLTKRLYRYVAERTGQSGFSRDRDAADGANRFLNHGNYLAYGLGATALWALGISHAFAVMHGKTRRGALVFDVADLIKDAIVLPWAFVGARNELDEQSFRAQILQSFISYKAMDRMIETIEDVIDTLGVAP